MYIFVDESGSTDKKNKQEFLVVAFALSNNRAFVEELIFSIKDKCKSKGKPILRKEVKWHELTQFQKEIAIKEVNTRYRNFYVCFFDVNSAKEELVTGAHEHQIQMISIYKVISKFNKDEIRKEKYIKIIMDDKLESPRQNEIKERLKRYFEMNKGITVETKHSSKERGIQLADIIAGAFRYKLMKKSDLIEVYQTHIFQISSEDLENYTENQ